jgi:hypothetical protein
MVSGEAGQSTENLHRDWNSERGHVNRALQGWSVEFAHKNGTYAMLKVLRRSILRTARNHRCAHRSFAPPALPAFPVAPDPPHRLLWLISRIPSNDAGQTHAIALPLA